MPKEKEGFREALARLDELFPGREAIKVKEACILLGANRQTLLSNPTFPVKNLTEKSKGNRRPTYIIPKVPLARWMC